MYRASLPGEVMVAVTTRSDGDFSRPEPSRGWTFVHQVHGNAVTVVGSGQRGELGNADALVSAADDTVLAVRGADCPLVALSSSSGVFAAVHAGWRGLLAGVIGEVAKAMRALGAVDIAAVTGPFIRAECYEFKRLDLDPLVARFGSNIVANTACGASALDLESCLIIEFQRADIAVTSSVGGCTACSGEFYSWRAFADTKRHALTVSRAGISS